MNPVGGTTHPALAGRDLDLARGEGWTGRRDLAGEFCVLEEEESCPL